MRSFSLTFVALLAGCNLFGSPHDVDRPVDLGGDMTRDMSTHDVRPDVAVPDLSIDMATMDAGRDAADPSLLFVVETEPQFLAGEGFDNVAWSDGIEIESLVGQNGVTTAVYESEIFDGGDVGAWDSVSWEPERPYFFPYPVGGRSETTYPRGNFDAEDLIFMSRFEAPIGPLGMNDTLVDDSENQRTVSVVGDMMIEASPIEGSALRGSGMGHLESAGDYAPNANDFTVTALVNTQDCPSVPQTIFAMDELAGNGRAIFLGCLPPGLGCVDPEMAGRTAVAIAPNVNEIYFACDPQPPASTWQHVAFVKRGTALSLFVDGQRRAQTQVSADPYMFDPTTQLMIGRLDFGNAVSDNLLMDELAFYHRALDDVEIEDQILRFWLAAEIDVRSCGNELCTDVPEWDQDPDVLSFKDSYDGPVGSLQDLPARRYIQFRLRFASLTSTESPRFGRVAIQGL